MQYIVVVFSSFPFFAIKKNKINKRIIKNWSLLTWVNEITKIRTVILLLMGKYKTRKKELGRYIHLQRQKETTN